MHITVILIAAISLFSGFSYALEEEIIDYKDLISHLVTIGASITAIVGVLITLNSNKRNLERSLEDAEKKHRKSLEEARTQFQAQMDKIEERNKIEDFHRYMNDLEKHNKEMESKYRNSNDEKTIEINRTSMGMIHKNLRRSEVPAVDEESIEHYSVVFSGYKKLCIELDEFLDPNNPKDGSILNTVALLNQIHTGPLFGLATVKDAEYQYIDLEKMSLRVLKAESRTYSRILNTSINCIASALITGLIYQSIKDEKATELMRKLGQSAYKAEFNASFRELKKLCEKDKFRKEVESILIAQIEQENDRKEKQ